MRTSYLVSGFVLVDLDLEFYRCVIMAHTSKSRLLVANPLDREFIHIYEALITSDLLATLDGPTNPVIKAKFPTIEHKVISFDPLETMEKRILSELLVNNFPHHVSDVPVGTFSNVINQHFNDQTSKKMMKAASGIEYHEWLTRSPSSVQPFLQPSPRLMFALLILLDVQWIPWV